MSLGIFSEIQGNYLRNNSEKSKQVSLKKNENTSDTNLKAKECITKEKVVSKIKEAAPIVIPLAAIPVTALVTYKISNKNVASLKDEILNLKNELVNVKEANNEAVKSLQNKVYGQNASVKKEFWGVILGLTGLSGGYAAGKLKKEDKEKITSDLNNRFHNIEKNSETALEYSNYAVGMLPDTLTKKHCNNIGDIPLLYNKSTKNDVKYDKAVNQIKNAADKYLYNEAKTKPLDNDASVWSVTSEFAPIKEGGLGAVPVDVQNNAAKLGISMPTFIPMYQNNGSANFIEESTINKDGVKTTEYKYKYGENKVYNLNKVAEFNVDTFRNGRALTEKVEIFVDKDTDSKKPLFFIKNDNYFNGSIYSAGAKTEEAEKFAFFSKAVYEFAKATMDKRSVKGLKVENADLFNSIKAPDALILNDWQASAIAALARFKAPMENAYGQLKDDAANKLKDMNIITIGHNAMYQGSTRNDNNHAERISSTSNILNTLFDEYAYDIVNNAQTGASDTDPDDWGLRNLDNILLINKDDSSSSHTNLLNMGICLSNYFHPVSKNYAEEIISAEHEDLAGELRWALNQKNNSGALVGIINGNDFNNLSITSKLGFIKKQTGLDFKTYTKNSDIEDVMNARTQNKIDFYNNYMRPFVVKNDTNNKEEKVEKIRQLTGRLELVGSQNNTNIPELTDEELKNTPIISSVGRLVSQKGIDVLSDAVKMLYDRWEKDFPGKNKPIFYIAGQDGEGGAQKLHLTNLKNKKLKPEDSNRVVFAHGFAPMAPITAASDFFILPSKFEPCGLTQGESFALATPVIASSVGGIVDTVNRDGKENGVLTEKSSKVTSKQLYEAMKKALTIYFEEPERYKNMVKDSLAEDFSWVQKGKKGPMFDYLEYLGFDKNKLPDIA